MTGQTEALGNDMYKGGGGGRAGMPRPGKDNSCDPVLLTASYQKFRAQHKKSKYTVCTRGRPGAKPEASLGDRG